MSLPRVAAALLLGALAVLVALLAADVRAWPAAIERGDALYALDPASAHWSASTRLGGLASSMLGTGVDLAERRALALYDEAIVVQQTLPYQEEIETARDYAVNALTAPATSSDRPVASQARTLQGVLAVDAASRGGGASQVHTAVADFTAALELDSANTAAKFDLELLLRLGQSQPSVFPAHEKSFGHVNNGGAGGSPPGSGY